MNTSYTADPLPERYVVPEVDRIGFLARLFSPSLMSVGENAVYALTNTYSSNCWGLDWDFVVLGHALYMAPRTDELMCLDWGPGAWRGGFTGDAAGIIVTLQVLSQLAGIYRNRDGLCHSYDRLLEVVARQPEAIEIFRAIE